MIHAIYLYKHHIHFLHCNSNVVTSTISPSFFLSDSLFVDMTMRIGLRDKTNTQNYEIGFSTSQSAKQQQQQEKDYLK